MFALVRLHERLGDFQAAADLLLKISRSSLDSETKEKIWADSIDFAYKKSSWFDQVLRFLPTIYFKPSEFVSQQVKTGS